MISRRTFVATLPASVAAAVAALRPRMLGARDLRESPTAHASHAHDAECPGCSDADCPHAHAMDDFEGTLSHPEPREGITGEGVVTAEQLREEGIDEEVIALYEGIRAIPEIADGIACYCGCMLPPMNNRSLLTCFHDTGMARGCLICQGTARLIIRRHAEGQSIDRIRAAVDARYAMMP